MNDNNFLEKLLFNLNVTKDMLEMEDINNAYEYLAGTIVAVNEYLEGNNE